LSLRSPQPVSTNGQTREGFLLWCSTAGSLASSGVIPVSAKPDYN
jgi:hypothetical protein